MLQRREAAVVERGRETPRWYDNVLVAYHLRRLHTVVPIIRLRNWPKRVELNSQLSFAKDLTIELGDFYTNNKKSFDTLFAMIIYAKHNNIEFNRILRMFNHNQPEVEEIAIRFFYKLEQSRKEKIRAAKAKLDRQQATAHERGKAAAKRDLEKQKNRKNNKFCKNDTEYYTTEDIEDIPSEELTFIKVDNNIFCLDNGSYVNMIKHSKDQKVRGDCKPHIVGRPVQCKFFYPILSAPRLYITEKSHNKRLKDVNRRKQGRKFILKNKKRINFDTGLHIVGIKTGFDNVYDLEPANFPVDNSPQKSARRVSQSKEKKYRKYTVPQLKAECKKKGIKGYSGKKKAELILYCSVTDEISSAPKGKKPVKITVKELKKMCKKLKIKGYSKWRKAELLKKCGPKPKPKPSSRRRSPGGISGLAPNAPLPLN